MLPDLKTCSFLGPSQDGKPPPTNSLPEDYATQPLKYLPRKICLSEAELELAARYEKGDFSGRYIASQIAYFRRGPSASQHARRRERFQSLKAEVDRLGYALPAAFIDLVETDDLLARLRHNSVWLQLPEELVRLPEHPNHILFLMFGEGQGCGYWHLLLAPDGGHIVTFCEHPFGLRPGLRGLYPPGREPVPSVSAIYRCADSFAEWIVRFSAESIAGDRRYEEILQKYPHG